MYVGEKRSKELPLKNEAHMVSGGSFGYIMSCMNIFGCVAIS